MSDDHTTFHPEDWRERPPVLDVGPAPESVFDSPDGDQLDDPTPPSPTDDSERTALAQELIEIRFMRNWTQAQLARQVGVSPAMIAHVERGTRSLSTRVCLVLADRACMSEAGRARLMAAREATTLALSSRPHFRRVGAVADFKQTMRDFEREQADRLPLKDVLATLDGFPAEADVLSRTAFAATNHAPSPDLSFAALTLIAVEMARLLNEYVEGTISMEDAVEAVAITDTFERFRSHLLRVATS